MDNKQISEDKNATNAPAEEILSEEKLDSIAGGTDWGGGTGTGGD